MSQSYQTLRKHIPDSLQILQGGIPTSLLPNLEYLASFNVNASFQMSEKNCSRCEA